MTGEPWLYAVLLALGAIQLLAVGYTVLNAPNRTTASGSAIDREGVDDDCVVCPNCEAVNERGYRFCWQCVGELPGAGRPVAATAPARNRNIF